MHLKNFRDALNLDQLQLNEAWTDTPRDAYTNEVAILATPTEQYKVQAFDIQSFVL